MAVQKKNEFEFKLKPIHCALAAMVSMSFTATSAAQENPSIENEAEVIKVTGVRTSLAAATANKRFSAQVVDSIVADDIGKLPDNTIAESLGRVAGVQVDQGIGEGSSISIRGLRDNVTLYNGRTIIDVNGRGGTGMDTLNTSTYSIMAMIPSALSKQLNVTKLASADMIDGGMGGVVNIESRKPLDVSGEQIAASYAANYNDQNKDLGHQLFGLYSNTFDNDKFGVLFSANYDTREVSQDGFSTYNGWTAIAENISVYDAQGQQLDVDSQGNPVQIIGNMNPRFQQLVDDRDRLSSSLIAQWRPVENLTLTSDLLYSKFDSIRDRYWLSTNFTNDLYDAELDENNFLVAANTEMFLENNAEYVDLTTDLFSGAVNADWDLTDDINIFAEFSYSDSKSERAQIYNRLRTLSSYGTRFDVREGEFGGDYSFDADTLDKTDYRWNNYFDNRTESQTTHAAQKIDLDWYLDNDIFTKFEAGVRFQQYDTNSVDDSKKLVPFRNQPTDNLVDYEQNFGLDGFFEVFSNSDYLPGSLSNLPRSFLIGQGRNIAGCESVIDVFNEADKTTCLNSDQNIDNLLSTWTVEETHMAAYAKINFEYYLDDMRLSGNLGGRWVSRDLDSTGYQAAGNNEVEQTTINVNNTEFLPSAIFNLDITDELKLKLGGAKVLAYPSTTSLRNAFKLTIDETTGSNFGNGGSPELQPFIATQYDLALEWYFNQSSAFTTTLFTKDIDSFVIPRQNQMQFEAYPDIPYFLIKQDANGEGGTIEGIEFYYQQAFDFLPQPFDGFGITASYAIINSDTDLTDLNGNPQPYLGLSKKSGNFIAYYEKGDHSIRMAYNFRDPYLQSIGSEDLGWYSDEYKQLAMTYKYTISDEISISLQGNNLTEENNKTYAQYPSAVLTNTERGRTFRASITARW